ncbi:MAG: DNA (cytosine-5-)-methyltransferase [Methanomassiliicoccales archaeon]|nr:MAG: DNA (cytosine-5-)-methyltransferase [Methanomassiliicoccales archaeon]
MEPTVIELFAGVGGFHLGLSKSGWKVVWADQWEPGKKVQHAFECYNRHYPGICLNLDISKVEVRNIPDATLLVGGFPCQDYSVATTKANGITGKKGVLWWDIDRILKEKVHAGRPIPYVLLENVDRLLKSPTGQRGRDFGMILGCLNRLGYAVEWRVINAADYGFPQKRRRTFIFATRPKSVIKALYESTPAEKVILSQGFFAPSFKVKLNGECRSAILEEDLQSISDNFKFKFENSGYMVRGKIQTCNVIPKFNGRKMTLRDVLVPDADDEFYVNEGDIGEEGSDTINKKTWRYCKGAKAEYRKDKNGYEYHYTEGAIPFPDRLDEPSRTLLTSDGNKRPNRVSHIILDPTNGRYRILTPVECERLNGFDDNWTLGMPTRWRYFCMGNALVVGLVEIMGKRLMEIINDPKVSSRVKRIDEF